MTGAVPDVRGYLEGAAVAVCPLRIARGVQNKILEAMAAAKATVASTPALQGIEARAGAEVYRADSPDEWTERVLALLENAELRGRLGAAARRLVEQKYAWEARMAPLVRLCEELGEAGQDKAPARSMNAPPRRTDTT